MFAYECGEQQRPEELAAAGERVYHQLRAHLSVLLGSAGFDALWARALHLAEQKFHIGDDTVAGESFSFAAARAYGLYGALHGRDLAAAQHNLAIAFASFVALLFTFIGQELGFRFIRQIWPNLPLNPAAP